MNTVTGQRHISLVLADRILEILEESGASEASFIEFEIIPLMSTVTYPVFHRITDILHKTRVTSAILASNELTLTLREGSYGHSKT